MPYIARDADGHILSVSRLMDDRHIEFASPHDSTLLAFLSNAEEDRGFSSLDSDLIRVIEDLIDVLIDKNVLRLTDLPHEAQKKLLARKSLRSKMRGEFKLLGDDDVL
ncbi:hypothetical protein HNQ59_001517 [Chitinivorax tropicus]|uniref:Tryptophan synthase subunit beta like protein n=1 Tax=Chitinivorax tropicus TaxID=714531 RepID=A0A840MNA8_9PROT|nr:hypothetical protein [Chitinivorax tropicus]MBB5018232.1 hypothetical protein [Chitinivorax tropicus]